MNRATKIIWVGSLLSYVVIPFISPDPDCQRDLVRYVICAPEFIFLNAETEERPPSDVSLIRNGQVLSRTDSTSSLEVRALDSSSVVNRHFSIL
jgi:hypothetical protein